MPVETEIQAPTSIRAPRGTQITCKGWQQEAAMKWWDDVWLNEGFATWMSSKPIKSFRPEWNFDLDDVSGTGGTLNVDALENTRPIHQAADTPAQIQELFDGIAYGKAASVLRMTSRRLKSRFGAG